jgi:hypothetical protein
MFSKTMKFHRSWYDRLKRDLDEMGVASSRRDLFENEIIESQITP